MSTSHVQAVSSPVPDYVDWLVAGFIALAGLTLTTAGSVLLVVFDEELLAEEIGAGRITVVTVERSLTDAEAVSLATDVVNWTGLGLLVTGIGLVVFAVAYGIMRYRVHREADCTTPSQHARHAAVCGAAVTALLSFLPFSQVFGGGVAAYLDRPGSGRSIRNGALSGVLAAVPAVVILAFVTVGVFTGLSGLGETSLRTLSVVVMTGSAVFAIAFSAGLGGLGGYVGDWLA